MMDLKLRNLLLRQFSRFSSYYLLAGGCLFLTHYIQSFLPFYARELALLVEKEGWSFPVEKFFWVALGIFLFRTSSRLFFFYPARLMERDMRVDLLEKLESASPMRYGDYSPGQLLQIIFTDTEQMRALVGFACLQVGNIVIAMLVLMPKLFNFHPQLLWGVTPMMLCLFVFIFFVTKTKKHYRKVQDAQGDLQNIIMEAYAGKKTIKNYHAEMSFIDLFKKKSWEELIYFYRAGKITSLSVPLIPLGVGLSLLWGGYIIHDYQLGESTFILFSAFVFLFLEPLTFLSWIGIVFTQSLASWDRIKKLNLLLNEKSSLEQSLEVINQNIKWNGDMSIKVEFWKKRISIPCERNKWTVIVGKTGCGKSSVLLQLAHVFCERKTRISYVGQTPYLYNDTVKNNIFLGRSATKNEMDEAYYWFKVMGLDYMNMGRDYTFSMLVGENGKKLSGGQAKRLCLIRSLMAEARILLWDDPFSSVDLVFEKDIIE
ncbi:MAG: ABC transporter ATP-binding protein, partial [Halobacteriovoraceae bacterium]|nr:ABC transporter ATP-binding protein [Halobacteriovoraceae bacterium]